MKNDLSMMPRETSASELPKTIGDMGTQCMLLKILLEESLAPAMVVADPDDDYRLLFVNAAAATLLYIEGKPQASLRLADCLPNLSSLGLDLLYTSADESGSASATIMCRSVNGQTISMHAFWRLSEPGGGSLMVAYLRDISGTIQTASVLAKTLRLREAEARSLLELSPDIIVRYDRDCRRIYVNKAYERVANSVRGEILGKSIREYWPPSFGAEMQELCESEVRAVLATGQERQWELSWTAADGLPVCFELRGVPECDGDGRVHSVLSFARDVSARVLTERKLQLREQAFRTLVENSPDLIVRYDKNCRRVFNNPAYERELGIDASAARNQTPAQFWRPSNIDAEQYMAILRRVMDSGEGNEVLLVWREDGGRQVRQMINLVAEYGEDGKVSGVLAIGRNVSAMWRQEMQELMRLRIFEYLARGGELQEILELVAEFVKTENQTYLCCIMLLDDDTNTLRVAVAPDLPDAYRVAIDGMEAREEIGACAAAACRNEPVFVENLCRHADWQYYREVAASAGLASCWSFPIVDSAQTALGTFAIYRREPGMPSPYDLDVIREARHLAAIAIERKRTEARLHRQACYDSLTGLPNRHLFDDRLREEILRAERGKYYLSLLFIDLDHFKEVNDTLGHGVGDGLLQEVARRIRACVRESDTVARLAGDEFVIILPELGDVQALERVTQSIVKALTQTFELGEQSAYVTASVGIAVYPRDAGNGEMLIGCADQAMYAAKESGRNTYSFFTRNMREHARQRLQLGSDLREALVKNQLEVYYQPIIDVAGGRSLKAEALLRWRHPELGMVPPDRFIPIAEETGLIQGIGAWVFCRAAETATRWNALYDDGDIRQISVNVSPRQFSRGEPVSLCIDHVRDIGLNPAAMVIEITEGLLLEDQADVIAKLRSFQQAGMQVALDDFGTGYSAMAYLKKFNIDYLKIDKSFIRDLETDSGDRAIAEAITVMAHRLGLKVIAEGVETEGQRDLLAAVGCEYLQGYLYAKPMPAETFLEFVRN